MVKNILDIPVQHPLPCLLSVRLIQKFVMAGRHVLYTVMCLLLFMKIGQGFEREGPKWDKLLQSLSKKPCVSIVATDLAPYHGIPQR